MASTDSPPVSLMTLDTAGLYFRAFYSVPEKITDPAGHPVNAVRGFCDMLATLLTEYRPAGLIAATDAQWRPDWRVRLIPSYKAQRVGADGGEAVPESLPAQVDTIFALLAALGVVTASMDDAEADDVLAALPLPDTVPGDTVIVTGDRDLFQLARSDRSIVYIGAGMAKRARFTPVEVAQRCGFDAGTPASAYADYAVFVGDASDGLPGVAGIGPAGAAKLINAFGDVDGVLAAACDDTVKLPSKQRAALQDAADYVRAAKRVVALESHPERVELTGSPQGRLGAVDEDAVSSIMEKTGQQRSITRLMEALAPVRGVD